MSEAAIRPSVVRAGAALLAGAVLAPLPAAAWEIAPHRAIYDLDLATARSGSAVSDVGGQMMFEWADACDGWTIEQRYRMTFLYTQGPEIERVSAYSTWESKDGQTFTFNLRNATDGVTDEEIRGNAEFAGDGTGVVNYRLPETVEDVLPSDTLFPTAHTLRLLDAAESDQRFFVALLFDGTDVNGLTEISAVVGDRAPATTAENPLLSGPSWPVQLAFFDLSDAGPAPSYEMSVRLYDNGVVDEMMIDYGDIVVRATLRELEALDAPDC